MIPSMAQKTPKTWYVRLLELQLTQIILAAIFLASDFFGGPFVQFPIAYIIPVALAAQFSNPRLSYSLAVIQPLIRFGFVFIWDVPWSLTVSIANAIIRMAVLLTIAYFINRTMRLTREIKRLEGFLPNCSFCKKIRRPISLMASVLNAPEPGMLVFWANPPAHDGIRFLTVGESLKIFERLA